jgi:uncharacterized membrane protein
LVVRDVVANLLHRLGMVGAIVIATALIFGAVAGGVVVHRLDTTPSASSEAQGAEAGDDTQEKGEKSHAGNDHKTSSETEDSEAKDD